MVAPSKVFTVIPPSDTDPDSPVSTNLMTSLADNDIHLEEWLGDGFTAAKDHDHDGVNSKKVDANNLLNLGSVQGALTLVENKSISSDQNDITFSGLDGETDGQYLLIARFENPLASSISYTLRLNTDDGNGVINVLTQNQFSTMFALIYAKRVNESETFEPAAFIHSVEDDGTAGSVNSIYTTIAANVTSIIIHGSIAGNNIKKGSRALLYKFKQS